MIPRRWHAFDVIARIFSERLRGSAIATEELRAMVRSPSTDWERIVGLASAQLVLPALAAALRDLQLLDLVDEELGSFLEAVHAANSERNAELRQELAAVVGILNAAGIEPVLLKGAIRLADGFYPDDGWRMLRDLDLLVPKPALSKAIETLQRAGYASCGSGHEIRRRGGICQIDLHSELFHVARQVRLVQAIDVLDRARPISFEGGTVRIPAVEHQVVHLIGHSQIRHLGHAFGRVALRHRLEAAALVHWGRERIEWHPIVAAFAASGYQRVLSSFLLALHDGNWCAAPVAAAAGLKVDVLTALQRRRIALQARSEALEYLGSRTGRWLSEIGRQFQADGEERTVVRNLRRLLREPAAAQRLARAVLERQRHLLHALPHLSWLAVQ